MVASFCSKAAGLYFTPAAAAAICYPKHWCAWHSREWTVPFHQPTADTRQGCFLESKVARTAENSCTIRFQFDGFGYPPQLHRNVASRCHLLAWPACPHFRRRWTRGHGPHSTLRNCRSVSASNHWSLSTASTWSGLVTPRGGCGLGVGLGFQPQSGLVTISGGMGPG